MKVGSEVIYGAYTICKYLFSYFHMGVAMMSMLVYIHNSEEPFSAEGGCNPLIIYALPSPLAASKMLCVVTGARQGQRGTALMARRLLYGGGGTTGQAPRLKTRERCDPEEEVM